MLLTGPQRKEWVETLIQAFPRAIDLEQMLSFELEINLWEITGGENYRDVVFRLINWAESQGKLQKLLRAAHNSNPDHLRLNALFQQYHHPAPSSDTDDLEKIIISSVPFVDVEPWMELIRICARSICRIELPAGVAIGTGFFVQSNILITNYHVLKVVLHDPAKREAIAFHFDYRVDSHKKLLEQHVVYKISSQQDWLITSSSERELDYILLHTEASETLIDLDRPHLRPQGYAFTHDEGVFVIQHPQGMPLRITNGSITSMQSQPARIFHSANTHNGSSGSPCLTSHGALAGLHCSGTTIHNGCIPFTSILDDLYAKKLAHFVDSERQ